MTLDDILRSPWFYQSPGPISIIYYGFILLLGMSYLLKRVDYPKHRFFHAFIESIFLTGFIVLSMDIIWISVSASRFLPAYPQDFLLVLFVLARNLVGMGFCYLFIGSRIKEGLITLQDKTILAYLLLTIFLISVFWLAPDPTWTDWTQAIMQGKSTAQILIALLTSYGIGKALSILVVWSWWKR